MLALVVELVPKPKIIVVALGGTIASSNKDGKAGVKPSISGEDLVNNIPAIGTIADTVVLSLLLKPSADLTFSDLEYASKKIIDELEGGADGIVVTQGTDTLEETAYFLNLVIQSNKPVVVTGAMRNPSSVSPDGDLNLLQSVAVACDHKSVGLGTLVVMNGEIHLSSFVQKTHTQNVATFKSPTLGPIGWVSEGKVRVILKPISERMYWPVRNGTEPIIPIVKSVTGDNAVILSSLSPEKIDGLIIEATGGGHVSAQVAKLAIKYCKTIPVILCSRTGSGEVLTHTYSFEGSEMHLIENGVIPSGYLSSVKARVLLYQLLKNGLNIEKIRATFGDLS